VTDEAWGTCGVGCDFRPNFWFNRGPPLYYSQPHLARPYNHEYTASNYSGLTHTTPGHPIIAIHRHVFHTRRPRAPPAPLFRCSLNQNPRILPDIRAIMLIAHMRLADSISHISSSKAQRQACEPRDKDHEHTPGPGHESA
jgi:hypothetical protein